MRFIPDRLGPKLGLFLVGMFVILGAATAGLIIFGSERTQNEATRSSREGLEEEGQRTLLRFTTSQADFAQAQMEATAGFAQQASRYLVDVGARQAAPAITADQLARTSQGVAYDPDPERRSDVLVPPGMPLDEAVLSEINSSAALDDLFPTLLAGFGGETRSPNFEPISIYYQSLNNVARLYPRVPDVEALPPVGEDLMAATLAVGPEQNPDRSTVWSPPYEDVTGRGYVMSATVPVYDGATFVGAVGVDFSLDRLIAQIESIKPTTNGFAFYIDEGGSLLPTSAVSNIEAELNDPRNTEFADVAAAIGQGRAEVGRAEIDGRDMFIAHVPLQGVGGTLALAAPVDEVTIQAAAVESTIEDGSRRTLLFALAGTALVFMLTLGAAAWLNRRLVLQPISEIVSGTRSLAAGDLSQSIPVRSHDELGTLAESFNGMTGVLRERTDDLREREEQYRAIFEASSDGFVITRVEDGVLVDVNPTMCSMHGYSREEMLRLHPTQFIHPDDHHLFGDYMATVSAGGDYRCRARDIRKDGTLFHVEVLGTPVAYRGEQHILGLVRDITAQVEAERILEERVEDRTSELAALLQVSQSVAAALNIRSVAGAILSELARVRDLSGATLAVVEGNDLVIVDSWGPHREEVVDGPTARFPRSLIPPDFWEIMERGAAVVVGDVRDDSPLARSYRRVFRPFLDTPSFVGIRSWLAVPMVQKGRVVGMLMASHEEPHRFTDDNTALIVAAASQAAVAMENARLFEETAARTDELQILVDVAQHLSSTIEMDPLLAVVLDQVQKVAEYDRVSVLLADEEQTLHVHTTLRRGGDPNVGAPPGSKFPRPSGPLFWATFERGQAVVIDDVRADEPLAAEYRIAAAPQTDATLAATRSWMGVPMLVNDRLIGILALTSSKVGAYNERQGQLATAIASHAAVAIENARLFEQTGQQNRESAALLQISNSMTSTLELEQLVRVILEQLHSVIEYTGSSVIIVSGQQLEILASRVLDPPDSPDIRGVRFRLDRDSEMWKALERLETVVIDDVYGESTFARAYRATVGRRALESPGFRNIRSWMAVPLAIKGEVVGMLSISRNTEAYFTPEHVRIATAVGKQAALAIENARLYRRAEERTTELSTLLDVSSNVASTIELQPLLDLILDQVKRVAPYDGATFFVLRGDKLRAESFVTQDDPDLDLTTIGLEIPVAGQYLWELVGRGETIIIDDVFGDTRAAEGYRQVAGPLLQTRFRRVKSWLGIPLMLGDRAIGLLALSGHTVGAFNEADARLARTVGDRAALAIENARLYAETSRHARETEALLRADAELFRSLSVDDVFQALCDVAVDVLGVDKCMVTTIQDASGRYTMRSSRGVSATALARIAKVRETLPRAALGTMVEPIIAVDARAQVPEMEGIFEMEGVVSTMDVPIRIEGQVRGDFALAYTRRHEPSADELRLFQALADRAAIAIQNAELYERSQQVASLEERQRLARELHDSVSQALYGIALGARTARTQLDRDPVKAIEPVEYVLSLAEAGLAEMRALIFELRPESLQSEGLVAAIEKHVASTRARYGLDVEAQLGTEPDVRIDVKEALYRVTQEALHNIVKHAHAQRVEVRLGNADGDITLLVGDDGRGFDAHGTYPGHVGLHSMRERVEKLHGTIAIESAPGAGSRVNVRIPVNGV